MRSDSKRLVQQRDELLKEYESVAEAGRGAKGKKGGSACVVEASLRGQTSGTSHRPETKYRRFFRIAAVSVVVGLIGLSLLLIPRSAGVGDEVTDSSNAALRKDIAALKRRLQGIAANMTMIERARKKKLDLLAVCRSSTHPVTSAALLKAADRSSTWLIVGIPTVPRPGDDAARPEESPLGRVLLSYASQVGVPRMNHVRVVVRNGRPGSHPVFERLRHKFEGEHWVSFVEGTADEDKAGAVESDGHELPSEAARKQSLDVIALLRHVQGQSKFYLFSEDDFALCSNGLVALTYFITRALDYQGTFTALRCGFGLNGIVMQNDRDGLNDVGEFADYLAKHYARRPPDHLVVEFFAKETPDSKKYFQNREVMAFRHNLFEHLGGERSTLRTEPAWALPGCFTDLIAPQVFEVEAWDPRACPDDDVWPCKHSARRSGIAWNARR